jgi:hypothetical protein
MKKYKDILITVTVVIIAPLLLLMILSKLPYNTNTEPRYGPPHNYWIPDQKDTVNKETKDWTGTTQGERTFEEMLSIEPDYMYYDTIDGAICNMNIDVWEAELLEEIRIIEEDSINKKQ